MDNLVRVLLWVGYIVGIIALHLGFLVSLMRTENTVWDYILPIALILIPIVGLLLAYKWPFIVGVVLINTGLFIGVPIIPTNVWAAAFFALPLLVTGFVFLLAGIFSWVSSSLEKYN